MKCLICGIAFLGSLLVSDATAADATAKDEANIQGVWRLISLDVPEHESPAREQPKSATMTIKGNKMLRRAPDGAMLEYEFKLNGSVTPKAIDIIRHPTNDAESKQIVLGVYSLDGDELKMCSAKPGKERPKELKKSDTNAVLVFRREKPNSR